MDFSDRYDEIFKQYSDFVIPVDPIWNVASQTGWSGYFPLFDDIAMQVNLAFHCEAVINLGSTMALDFAAFNKPCFYFFEIIQPKTQTGIQKLSIIFNTLEV